MTRGRRSAKRSLVDRLQGSAEAKQRLRLVLETLAGACSIPAAGALLGIGRRRFYDLRRQLLENALQSLELRPPGRPTQEEAKDDRVAQLEAEIEKLRIDLTAARVREEIALAMPHLLRRAPKGKKPRTRRPRNSPAKKPPT